MRDSFDTRDTLAVKDRRYGYYRLDALENDFDLTRLPYSIKVLLENLLRHEDGANVRRQEIEAVADWNPHAEAREEILFTPARVLLQDFTGVPAMADLAAMREAMVAAGGAADSVNPLVPAELVIDHSVQVDAFGKADAADLNARLEFERNRERYTFLRWAQRSFRNFRVVPPDTGIVHQVNLEYLARVVFAGGSEEEPLLYPDTLVGTDSHTTMINGLGVLGWGVGGIEAEAAMLGQPVTLLTPDVVGVRLSGHLPEGTTATDLVLTITQMLREKGVVGRFVEFFGDGLDHLPLADRATIANMAPEYGATCAMFPVDAETLRYLELSGRSPEQLAAVETYARAQGMFRESGQPAAVYTEVMDLDLEAVEPSLAGPRRPQDRVPLRAAKGAFRQSLHRLEERRRGGASRDQEISRFFNEGGSTAIAAEEAVHAGAVPVEHEGERFLLRDGSVVIAAITSCTNTSNPAVLVAAGLLARKARRLGLTRKPWVKTSLAPGSQVVTEYLRRSELLPDLEALGFYLVGYGCTTCIGNSGPLPAPISEAIREGDLFAAAVLSGNRNFEGRIHADVQLNYLASPPLVVAYALAGTMDIDMANEPLGTSAEGKPVYLRDLWPDAMEVQAVIDARLSPALFRATYGSVFEGDRQWAGLPTPEGDLYAWDPESSYIRRPPFFEATTDAGEIHQARVLARLGDTVTTDHISPAGAIPAESPAGEYLQSVGVGPTDFNSYGARRGNHEVMLRGTFANIRLRNALAPGTEGGWTRHQPSGDLMSIDAAARRYQAEGVPLIVLAGREYGTGSSRDWAAKGPRLLGVRAVLAESFERIHRSNLVGMGILPLQLPAGETLESLGLDGSERYTIPSPAPGERRLTVTVRNEDGTDKLDFRVEVRIDTPKEWDYFGHGGILPYVLDRLAGRTGS